jgi:hypothetical protein
VDEVLHRFPRRYHQSTQALKNRYNNITNTVIITILKICDNKNCHIFPNPSSSLSSLVLFHSTTSFQPAITIPTQIKTQIVTIHQPHSHNTTALINAVHHHPRHGKAITSHWCYCLWYVSKSICPNQE